MVATLPIRASRKTQPATKRSLGYDFALLGLTASEARVQVIREAALSTAGRIHDAAIDDRDHDSMLSDLATSTYRLLDPRKRSKPLERVQLCIFSEEDLQAQHGSRARLVTNDDRLVAAELVEKQTAVDTDQSARVQQGGGMKFRRVDEEVKRLFRHHTIRRFPLGALAVMCAGALTLTFLFAF